MTPSPSNALMRGLGFFDATSLVVGSMIGSGIFIVSAESARVTGSSGWLLTAWVLAGAMTLVGALCCAELAAMLPRAGGQYLFFREAYGRPAGFLYGWTMMLVVQTGTIAAVSVAFARFLGLIVPAVSTQVVLLELGPLKVSAAQAVAAAVVLGLTATNATGLRAGASVQNVFTAAKLLGLLALIVLGLSFGTRPSAVDFTAPSAALGVAMVGPLFSQSAWNNVTFAGEEIREPGRTLPRALLVGCVLVTALYLAANVAYLSVLSLNDIQHAPEDRVATAMMTSLLGDRAAVAMALAIMISTFGCVNGLILSGARVSFAMARDGLFFRRLADVNAAHVPRNALWAQAAWAVVLVLSGGYSELLRYEASLDEALRREHQSASYRVAFIGFAPGFPYLVGLPPSLHRPRLATPRVRTPAGSVAVAGEYCGIYPAELPGGWNVIGRTALRLFDARAAQPSLLAPGDEVRFQEGDAPTAPAAAEEPATFPLRFVSAPRGASVRGGPRFGWGHFGVPSGGAMDLAALEEGNARVGNAPHAPGLEIALLGPELEATRDGFVCLTGAAIEAPFEHRRAVRVRAGERFKLGRVTTGARSYLCFGEQAVEDVTAHDVTPGPLRVREGPQADHFAPSAWRALLDLPWKVSAASDRRGVRLDGAKLEHSGPTEIPPEGTAPGAIQVPASGQPIILGPDRPVTGGYPKIATVVSEDLPRLAQLRPGSEVRFLR